MALHRNIISRGIYFITFTCYQWLHLFEKINGYDLVYNWFDILSSGGQTLNGFVIMPNHLHMLLHYAGGRQSLNTIVGNGKRFMAYEIINRIKKRDDTNLLAVLKSGVTTIDRNCGKQHSVWQDSFDAKECRTDAFTFQKLQYIHNNPCSWRWNLAKTIIDYRHSSVLQYISGKTDNYPVRDYREFLRFEQ